MPRILRDMNDGVLVLDARGEVLFLNENGGRLLGLDHSPVGEKYGPALLDAAGENDAFHQLVLDAIYDKDHTHSGVVPYRGGGGEALALKVTTSFLMDEQGVEQVGVVVLFTDVTETERLQRQRRESSVIFAVLTICVTAYLFLWSGLRYLDVPAWVMTQLVQVMALVMLLIILKTTSFSIRDIGLRVTDARATFVPALLITAGGVAVLAGGKLLLLRVCPGFFPAGAPFWDWSVGNFSDVIYPLTVVLQEFLARGAMQENLRRIFVGKHAALLSVAVSSLLFGVLHIAYGLPYMLGAALLLGALGALYEKQGNIWGLCVIHYVLGEVAVFLRYLV